MDASLESLLKDQLDAQNRLVEASKKEAMESERLRVAMEEKTIEVRRANELQSQILTSLEHVLGLLRVFFRERPIESKLEEFMIVLNAVKVINEVIARELLKSISTKEDKERIMKALVDIGSAKPTTTIDAGTGVRTGNVGRFTAGDIFQGLKD
jgi:hypothetical protein